MKTFIEFINKGDPHEIIEMVAGDSGGDAMNIASGANSGSVVLGNRPKRKRKAKATPAEVGLPEDELPDKYIN